MKAAKVITILLCFLCATSLFVSMAEATDVAQNNPMGGGQEYGTELASGRCIHGCCNRTHILRRCKVCCPSAEAAKAFAMEVKGRLESHGGQRKP